MIHEINHLKELEVNTGVKIPMPNFFYIEKYGRKLEDQMEELLPVLGKKEWFLFKTDCRFKEGGLLHNFIIELEKHAKLGKDYDECILVELTEDIQLNEEFPEFLYYLKSQEEKIYFIFTMKQSKDTAFIQECIVSTTIIHEIRKIVVNSTSSNNCTIFFNNRLNILDCKLIPFNRIKKTNYTKGTCGSDWGQ